MRNIIALFVLWLPLAAIAQQNWGSIVELTASKKIVTRLSANMEIEHKTFDNFKKTERVAITAAVDYKFNKYLKIGGGYVFINQNRVDDGWEKRNRWFANATGIYKWNGFTISLRERFQSTHRNGVSEYNKKGRRVRANPKYILRTRAELEYEIQNSHFEIFGSAETFHKLNDPDGNGIDKVKYTLGSDYSINKRQKITLFYRYNYLNNSDNTESTSQIGVGYSIKF